MPDTDATELDLVQQLARRLRRTAVDTSRWGLSPHQARALEAVSRRELRAEAARAPGDATRGVGAAPTGIRVSELASRLQIAPRSATEVADALEERGLVRRTPDPADRRAVLLTVTPVGHDVAKEIRAERRVVANRVLEGLSATERAELRRLLSVLLTAVETGRGPQL